MADCLAHLQEKHGGSQFVALNNLGKFFPPWTVPRAFWLAALRPDVSGVAVDVKLFHDLRRHLVHKYRIYRDPIPHPALRGRVVSKLIDFVCVASPGIGVDPAGFVRQQGCSH